MKQSKDNNEDRSACKYPVKLNSTQEKILFPWVNSLRYLWNRSLALILRLHKRKIRLMYERINKFNESTQKYEFVNLNGTNKHLTKIRGRDERQSSIPNCAQQEVLRRLDKAYSRFLFDKPTKSIRQQKIDQSKNPKDMARALNYGFPKFKAKCRDIVSIFFSFGRFSVIKDEGHTYIELSKVPGRIRILNNKEIPDTTKNATLSYDPIKDMWFISFTYVTEHVRRDYPVKDVVGMDVGIRKTCFLSNGESHKIDNERILFLEGKKARLQRFLDRKDKKNKSKRYLKFARKIAMIDRLISNVRSNFNHHLSKHITDTFPIIGGEDLSIKHMMASASGTVESPGHNVKQKSGLNRAIARQGWGQLRSMVAYKQKRNGGVYTLINPAYTSLTCTSCGHVSKSNRNGECFKCENCGKEIDADYNASIEIRKRTIESLPKEVFDKFNIDKDVL